MNIKSRKGDLKAKVFALAFAITLSGATAIAPFAAMADNAALIAKLQADIAALQAQLLALKPSGDKMMAACTFTRALTVGMKGDDVKCLQSYLMDGSYYTYSGGATGYFGNITKNAVASWQAAMGVSPAAGYFGAKSQAKYSALVAKSPPPPPPGPPGPPGPPPPPPVGGTGLTVAAAMDQPAAATIPEGAARVPFVKLSLMASADGDITVKNIEVERRGLADDAAFDGIIILDENGVQIGNTKTLSSDHKVKFNQSFVVKAGTSKTVWVSANMNASLDSYQGQLAKLAVVAVDAGSAAVSGSLPIESAVMSFNSTLTIGSVTMTVGSLDPGAANTKNVGTKGYYLTSVKASVGSAEDVTFEQIRFNQAGSAAATDIENVMVKAGGTDYKAEISADAKYYVAKFPGGLKVTKGGNVEFSVKADLINGSARTVDMDVLRKSDIVAKGNVYGFYVTSSGGSTGSASAGAFSSNTEPFYNAYAATINLGTLQVSSSNKVPAGNVGVDLQDTILGGFHFDVKGEPVQISSWTLNWTFSGTGTSSNVTSVKLYDSAGNIVAGPKDPASGVVVWSDTWTAPVGEGDYYVKGKLSTTFASNDTVQVSVLPTNITSKGSVTGLSITPTPSTLVTSNTQTVKAGAMAMSVSPTPFGQNVTRGINGYLFGTLVFDAGSSGEDARVTVVKIRDTLSAAGAGDEVNSCVLYDGAAALVTGSDVVNPSDPSGTTNDLSFTLTTNLMVPKGTVKKIDLKCNISSSASSNSTHSFGLNDTTGSSVAGATTNQSITESVTTGVGSTMTIKTAGSFTVTKDASAPTQVMILSGKTDVPMNVLRYHATDEAVTIQELTLTYSSSTASTSDFLKVSLWDGATKIGEAVWAGSAAQNATSTLNALFPFVVPKDGDKLLTIKADISDISVVASTTQGRLLAIDYNGVSSSSGVGQSSGQKLGSGSSSNTDGANFQIMKSMPKVDKIAVPSTSVPQADAIMYRFKVAADAAGPIALFKFTFDISSSSVSATTSNFRIYGYTDSGFSVAAYAQNPLSVNNVDCAGFSNLNNSTASTACGTNTASDVTYASTTLLSANRGGGGGDIVFFFNPVANLASTTEAIIVPAGETRYFEMRGDITNPGSGTGNSISVSLLGDAARPVRNGGIACASPGTPCAFGGAQRFMDGGRGGLATAAEAATQSANNDFIWSPLSTSTTLSTATSTADWTNGFLVPGLPSVNLSSNSFTN